MAYNRRAKRRLTILIVLTIALVIVGSVAWVGRQIIRNRGAESARVDGLALLAQGDYENALPKLSTAISRNKDDVELLIGFAKARSRVPIKRGKHLLSSIALYRRALNYEPNNLEALNALLQLQYQSGMLAQVVETAKKIRELDPSDPRPLRALMQAAIVRGRIGPTSITLGTEEDESALRWVDELIVIEPESIQNRIDRLIMMEQVGRSKSEILSLAESWTDESENLDGQLDVVLAQAYLIHELPDEALKAITEAVDKGINDPQAILIAMGVLDRLRNVELKDFVSQQAQERALSDPILARAMVMIPWQEGKIATTNERIEKYTDVLSNAPNDLLFLAQMYAVLGEYDQAELTLQQVRDREWDQEAISNYEDQITLWEQFLTVISGLDHSDITQDVYISKISLAEEEIATALNSQFSNYILGLMYQKARLNDLAMAHFRKAVDRSGVLHVMPGQRLIEGLLQQGRALEALPISESLIFRHNQSLVAYIEWIRVRAALDRMGVSASENGARIRPYEDSYELAKSLFESTGEGPQIKTLLIQTALATKNTSEALDIFNSAIENDEFSPSNLVFLAENFTNNIDSLDVIELLDLMIDKLAAQDDTQEEIDAIVAFKTLNLRRAGLIEEAEAAAIDHYKDRDDLKSRQILMLEKLENSYALNETELPDWVSDLINSNIDYSTLQKLMSTAILTGNLDVAIQIKKRVDSMFGEDSQPALLVEVDLILGFPDVAELQEPPFREISSLVGELELQLDREPNSSALVFRQFRLLDMLDPNDPNPATNLLIEMVTARPDALEFYPPLIAHLQELGRFREAEQYISRFEKQKFLVSPNLRYAVDQLRLGQGDPDEALKAMRRSANAPSATVEDKLGYVRLAFIVKDYDDAKIILNELMQDPDRPIEVDRQYALSQLRDKDIDGAVSTLRSAPGFTDPEMRTLYITNLYLAQGQPQTALEELKKTPGILSTSYQANNLAGQAHIALGDINTASLYFDNAMRLGSDTESVQLSVLSLMIEEPELRAKAIPQLESILKTTKDPGNVEAMLIAANSAGAGDKFEPTDEYLARSIALTNQYPGNKLGWTLAVNLHLAAINKLEMELRSITNSVNEINLEQLTALNARHSKLVNETDTILRNATNRFEADVSFPRNLSFLNYGLGKYEESLRFANEAEQRFPGVSILDSLLQGQALLSLGRYENASKILSKHKQEIVNISRNMPEGAIPPKEFGLLIEALLLSGKIDEASEVLQASGLTSNQLFTWQSYSTNLNTDDALLALQVVEENLPQTSFSNLRLMQSWTVIARKVKQNQDVALQKAHKYHQQIQESLSTIAGVQSEDPWFGAQVELSLAGLQEINSIADARNTYSNVVDMVPSNIREALQRFSQLSPEERQSMSQWANILVTSLNNQAASSAKLNTDLQNALDAANEALRIFPNSADILDTRAMVHIAAGRGYEAVEDSLAASKIMPNRLDFKLTLAEGYAVQGNIPVALELISEVERLNILQIKPEDTTRERAEEIRKSLTRRQAG